MKPCSWPPRWWHRHLRAVDRVLVLGRLQQHTDARRALVAWTLHKQLPGQEHWRCACAQGEPDA